MTLEEAIKNAEEVVKEMSYEYQECISAHDYIAAEQCGECAQKQNQLAEWLKELKDYRERIPSYEAGYNDAKKEIALSGEYERVYERGKSDAEQTRWIPVSERLPEDHQRVLITVINYAGNKVVRVAEYRDKKKKFQVKENSEEWEVGEKGLLAWRPLPEPYKA